MPVSVLNDRIVAVGLTFELISLPVPKVRCKGFSWTGTAGTAFLLVESLTDDRDILRGEFPGRDEACMDFYVPDGAVLVSSGELLTIYFGIAEEDDGQ